MATPFPFVDGAVLTAPQMNAITTLPVSTKTVSYALLVGDVGSRVTMNAAGATTVTVNTSVFAAGDMVWIQNIGAGTTTVTAGSATVTTSSSLALPQWGGGTLYFTSTGAAIFFSQVAVSYGAATGGIGAPTAVTISGVDYKYLTFNSTGDLTVTKSGLFDVLIFGGGAGSPRFVTNAGSGGGGGGISRQTIYLDANATVTIGGGGAAWLSTDGANLGNASHSSIGVIPIAIAALGGTGENNPVTGAGRLQTGSGSGSFATLTNDGTSSIQGYKGGGAAAVTNAGGGGGAAQVGANGAGTTGGAGGNGYDISVFIGGGAAGKGAGGGAGGSVTGGAAGLGGVAGSTGAATAGAANTGNGAGGGYNAAGANGGSGIAYIRFKV